MSTGRRRKSQAAQEKLDQQFIEQLQQKEMARQCSLIEKHIREAIQLYALPSNCPDKDQGRELAERIGNVFVNTIRHLSLAEWQDPARRNAAILAALIPEITSTRKFPSIDRKILTASIQEIIDDAINGYAVDELFPSLVSRIRLERLQNYQPRSVYDEKKPASSAKHQQDEKQQRLEQWLDWAEKDRKALTIRCLQQFLSQLAGGGFLLKPNTPRVAGISVNRDNDSEVADAFGKWVARHYKGETHLRQEEGARPGSHEQAIEKAAERFFYALGSTQEQVMFDALWFTIRGLGRPMQQASAASVIPPATPAPPPPHDSGRASPVSTASTLTDASFTSFRTIRDDSRSTIQTLPRAPLLPPATPPVVVVKSEPQQQRLFLQQRDRQLKPSEVIEQIIKLLTTWEKETGQVKQIKLQIGLQAPIVNDGLQMLVQHPEKPADVTPEQLQRLKTPLDAYMRTWQPNLRDTKQAELSTLLGKAQQWVDRLVVTRPAP